MFPLSTLRKKQTNPTMTIILIVINVLVFFWELTLSQGELHQVFLSAAVIPCEMSRNLFSVETIFDSVRTMFLHGGWVHLIGNMVFLYLFGPYIEDYLGKFRYLAFYLLAGFAASFAHTAIHWNVCIPTIGASGAIYGVMGAFLLLYPATKIRTIAFFFRVPVGTVDVQAFYMIGYYFIFDFINGLASLGEPNAATNGVAVWAHIGGFIAGLLMAFIVMIFKDPPPLDDMAHLDF